LEDQCPRIGSGRRGITILSVGPKWARFKETATGTAGKLSRRDWDYRYQKALNRQAAALLNPKGWL
jgi:hypothetical protein